MLATTLYFARLYTYTYEFNGIKCAFECHIHAKRIKN